MKFSLKAYSAYKEDFDMLKSDILDFVERFKLIMEKDYDITIIEDNPDTVNRLIFEFDDSKIFKKFIPIVTFHKKENSKYTEEVDKYNRMQIDIMMTCNEDFLAVRELISNQLVGNKCYIDNGIILSDLSLQNKNTELGIGIVVGAETDYISHFSMLQIQKSIITNQKG